MQGHREMFWLVGFGPNGAQGGVCISVRDSLHASIVDRDEIVPGRARWMIIQWRGLRHGILSIYASNHESARVAFWTQLIDALPSVDAWCIAGDFNMIESPEDRQGGSHVTVHGTELAAWERLCMALGLHDVWHLADFARERDSLRFSRSNRRIGGMNLSRIDRIYVSDALSDYGGTTSIITGSCMSDHAPVVVVFRERDAHVSSVMRIPESVQLDESLTEQI